MGLGHGDQRKDWGFLTKVTVLTKINFQDTVNSTNIYI